MNMRKICFALGVLLLISSCGSDTVEGDPNYGAENMLTADIGGKKLFLIDHHDGTVSVTYDQRNPLHKNKKNQYVLTDYTGELVIPSRVTINNNDYTVVGVTESAFMNNTSLTKVVLPSTVTSIGNMAFYNCSLLEEVNIPEGVKVLPKACFSGCKALKKVDLPSALTSVGVHCFRGCSGLTELKLPSSLRTISRLAFYACSKVVVLEIPEGITELGDSAFAACSGLIEVILPETLTTLGEGTFAGCRSMFVITLPESVKTIGAKCFYSLDNNGNGNWRNLEIQVKSTVPPVALGSFVNQTNRRRVVVPRGYRDVYMSTPYWDEFTEVLETNY